MKRKIETAIINSAKISVDVSFLQQTDELFFNATDMASSFGKRPNDWLSSEEAKNYIEAILITRNSCNKKTRQTDLVRTQRGKKYGGTWLHNDLGLAFARWLSPLFAVKLDRWTRERLKEEISYREARLEAKTGFLPMTKAIADSKRDAKHYHYSNEVNLLYRIVLGVSAKQFKKSNGVKDVRSNLTQKQLSQLNDLQIIDTGLLKMKFPYDVRKEWLQAHHENKDVPHLLQAMG
ncbi:MAG: KilA-N domain-containing protein [Bacteroidetes bacterium]|nr:KilA-N domain-containing protein [Bacteroidota bacterium]